MTTKPLHITTITLPDPPPSELNTHKLTTAEEIAALSVIVPLQQGHSKPDFWLSHFGHYKKLITASQHISAWHAIPISNCALYELSTCQSRFQREGKVSADIIEDAAGAFTSCRTAFSKYAPAAGYFVRLDEASPKDAQPGGLRPVRDVQELVRVLATSERAWRAVQSFESRKPKTKDERFMLYLLPWNEEMACEREFRVFVPPSSTPTISAISQYRCAPSIFTSDRERATVAETVYAGAQKHLAGILEHVKSIGGLEAMLAEAGFVFDLVLTQEGDVQLLEVNPFGALSGCGSCMFHWLNDARSLYGLTQEVEFAFGV